jgi:hypothetical protein
MAVTLDGTNTQSALETGASSLTFARTTGAGSNKGLVVTVVCYGANRATSSVTYATIAMTKLIQGDGNNINCSIWYLPAPATGANNVVITQPAGADGISGAAIALFGAQQTTTADSTADADFNVSGGKTTNITTVAASCWIFDGIGDQTAALTKGAAQTLALNQFGQTGGGSYKTDVTAGANSMAWTWTGSDNGHHTLAAIAPVAAAVTYTSTRRLLMGIGI